ncbi:MAG: hypothetical protein ACOX47_06255 [Bacillota bacterium]|jgi:stage III sporulation protein AG
MSNKEKRPGTNIIKITKDQWPFIIKLLAVAFLGIVILNFANIFNTPKQTATDLLPVEKNNEGEEETGQLPDDLALEKRLENILSKMDGVGSASVSIVFSEGPTKEYAVNVSTTNKEIQEKDQSGGTRTTNEKTETGQMVMINGNAQPVLVKESMPKIQGVLIVAEGVEDPAVKERLFKAVQTLLQVPAHRITISSRNGG